MTDESIMPWGKHKGEKMANAPPSYLLWLLENNKCGGEVKKSSLLFRRTSIAGFSFIAFVLNGLKVRPVAYRLNG